MEGLPCRGAGVRSLGLAIPPERMPLMRWGRPLKRWRYVGFYAPEVMLCAGDVHVGPLRQQFWAVQACPRQSAYWQPGSAWKWLARVWSRLDWSS